MIHINLPWSWICTTSCLLFNLVLLDSIKPSFCTDANFTACAAQTCAGTGTGTGISYPFWIKHQQESRCGYTGFDVSCNAQNEAIIDLAGSNYSIENIFHDNQSIRVVYSDFVNFSSRNTCSIPPHNFTPFTDMLYDSSINDRKYELPSRINYSRLYLISSCVPSIRQVLEPYKVNGCLSWNESNPVFAIFHYDYYVLAKVDNKCGQVAEMLVDLSGDDYENGKKRDANWLTYFEDVVSRRGVLLKWKAASECDSCRGTGGRCGLGSNYGFMCYCADGPFVDNCSLRSSSISGRGTHNNKKSIPVTLILAFAVPFSVILVGSMMFCWFRRESIGKFFTAKSDRDHDLDEFIRNYGSLAPKQYNYSNIKRITNSFANKLGQGGYGCVYKGKLSDGRHVAVKILNESKGNDQEFLNEVASISRTSHVNVISLLGFCYKGTKRALIYEFMSNISLDKFLYKGKSSSNANLELDRAALFKIAIGIARGLEYLHSGCNTRILHLDIKPHNILLDHDWCPKISDFGLAKLCLRKESVISTMGARGTIGYIAPEVFNRGFGRVSYKSDVYSYGMMILEMAGVGKQAEPEGLVETSEMYFPDWIYKRLEAAGSESAPLGDDGVMGNEENNEIERKMIIVGLWCIQTKPADRPSITRVIEMLEGSCELLQTPPKPFLFPPTSRSPRKTYSSSSLSSSISQIIEIES